MRKSSKKPVGRKPRGESVEQYTHTKSRRPNNPPVGLVTPGTDPDQPSKRYSYDPRLDPQLQWSGKRENSKFEVDTVSLHVHERIDPLTILEKVMKSEPHTQQTMYGYFKEPGTYLPLREAIDFYKHDQGWSNRLIAGDSLLVMNSLLEKEGMEGKVQMVYIDPPYGIKYASNFQPFIHKRNVKDGNDKDLTQEPEMIKAFRDTWELGIHSYLSYMYHRVYMAKSLLNESGSIFIQISDRNVHLIRQILDEIFGAENFVMQIQYRTSGQLSSTFLSTICDYIIWYAKDKKNTKFRRLFTKREKDSSAFTFIHTIDGEYRKLTMEERKNLDEGKNLKVFTTDNLVSSGYTPSCTYKYNFKGRTFFPSSGRSWKVTKKGMKILEKNNRLIASGKTLRYVFYYDDYPVMSLTNIWEHLGGAPNKVYVVQTNPKVIQRCMLMCTDPGDLVLDPTCGSGTTAYVAEQWGRRWITCDTSRIAIAIARQRLMLGIFDYYDLAQPQKGLKSGFKYKTSPHITAGSVANEQATPLEILYDDPEIDKSRMRVTGPFTVEAVPSPVAKSIDILSEEFDNESILQNVKTSTQQEWRDELQKTGIKGKGGRDFKFTRVEPHPTTKWLHADAEIIEDKPKRVMISFGPEHAPLEQRQVARAMEEAETLIPKPKMVIFVAMQFDPEASKDIDELSWPGVKILKVEMNKDLLTKDLKKKRSNNESFWLMGQPDVGLQETNDKKYIVTVRGFDYYNTETGGVESGNSSNITMWMLDTDYDGRSVYPQQIFFPMWEKTGGWHKLAKTLNAQIDEEMIAKYRGIESIPFEAGPNKRAAVKIIDDRGIESLKIISLE